MAGVRASDTVALVRPRPKREAYLVTETLSGEQAQVDWAYVGKVAVPGGERGLWGFVMVLAHSRAMWGEFVIDLTVHSLCRSLVRGATALGGPPGSGCSTIPRSSSSSAWAPPFAFIRRYSRCAPRCASTAPPSAECP